MSDDYEFEDDEPVKKPAKGGASPDFDPFADEDAGSAPAAPAAKPSAPPKPSAPGPSSDGGFDAFADAGDPNDPDAVADDADIKPGQGKNLWVCPHCGAKNKPNRDTCRACGKHPDDEVIVPLFSRPPVKIGLLVAVVLIAVIGFMVATAKDLSLRAAGSAHVTADYVSDGVAIIAGSGRILKVNDKDNRRDLVLVFGPEIVNDKEFKGLKGPNKDFEVTRGGFSVQPHLRLSINGVGALPDMKRGQYVGFSGSCNSEEKSFSDGLLSRSFDANAADMSFNVADAD